MSSSVPRNIHQDYIARIRYSNALPPPPNPPKLLDIPNTGLASGQYTTPGFASRLARDQPLNIEADAELGMPLDLVGMPGIFDGDESSIQAPLNPPVPHPHDRALLRPLSTLGKPKFSDSGVSFLRRTEYISSYTSKSRFDSTTSKSLVDNTGKKTKRTINIDKESPEAIKNDVEKSFKTAADNLKNSKLIRHPTKRDLILVDAIPLLPDLKAFPDVGGYVQVKFLSNPVPPSTTYDVRLEGSILRPCEQTEAETIRQQQMQAAYERDPERNPAPDGAIEYEFFMNESIKDNTNFKRKIDPLDPECDSDDLYTQQNAIGAECFRFKRVRAYEAADHTGDAGTKYNEVVVATHDGSDGLRPKGAYFYPIIQQLKVRPQRSKNIEAKRFRYNRAEEDAKKMVDFIDMTVEAPTEETQNERDAFAIFPFGKEDDEEENGETAGEAPRKESEIGAGGDGDGNGSD